ncbi:MAG: type I restriction-modification system subunit M [Fuerstiella sp.]
MLWKACDTFRGAVDPSEYKNYILVMLFVKYISDVWQDHYETLKAEYADDEERIQRRLKRERFVLPAHCTFGALYEQRNAANIGEIINTALDEVEDSNKEKLEGVFRNIDFNSEASLGQTKERNTRLKSLLEDFSDPKLDLRPSRVGNIDVIGNAYEYLIGRFAAGAGKKAGEFYTPPEVSQLIARLVDPQPGERICDPACGSGSLLIKCGQQVGQNHQGSQDFSLYGQENIGATWALAKMNMFLHAMDNARIEWGDTIRNPKLLSDDRLMKFEVVVANPPFSLDKWGQEEAAADHYNRFHRGVPPKSKGDYAFISHMIETITETSGRVGVVVPHGVLFRGSTEGKIRKQLIEENVLDAVVGLPGSLFYGTGIPAAILIFRKQKLDEKVMFIDASRDYEEGKNQNRLADQHIKKIVDTYKARGNVERYSYVADVSEIKENDFTLSIPRYVDTFEAEEGVDLSGVQGEINEIDNNLLQVQSQIQSYLKELGL